MGIFRLKVKQRGTIVVDGVDSLEEAKEYIESCNPVDDVKWSGFLETMQGGIELQKISIPEFMTIMDFADRILVRPAEIIKWLFLHGKIADFKSPICFDDMKEFADGYGFICEKEGKSIDEYIINIEEIRASDRLKKEKCSEAKAAIRDILPDGQKGKFDKAFDNIMGKALKGVVLKRKDSG